MKKIAGEGGAKQNVGCWRIDPGEAKKKNVQQKWLSEEKTKITKLEEHMKTMSGEERF